MKISTLGFVAGLDIGYGNIKGVGGSFDGSDVCEFILPSGAAPISAMPKRGLDPDLKGGEVVVVDGVEWVAGVDQHHIQGGVKQTHSAYVETREYKALYLAALSRFGVPRIRRLVTGLPVQQFFGPGNLELIAKIKDVMKGTHRVNAMTTVQVDEVSVVSQPAGCFAGMASLPEYAFLAQKGDLSLLVVDVGFGTSDWIIVREQSILDKSSKSSTLATSHILELTADAMSKEFSRMVSRDRLDMLLRTGQKSMDMGGTEVDFMARLMSIGDEVGEQICSAILASTRSSTSTLDYILLTGGGAFAIENAIRRRFPQSKVICQTDPILGNVRGYLAISKAAEINARRASISA